MRRPGSKNKVWLSTPDAAAQLGITKRQLRLLKDDLNAGEHYRSISKAGASRPTYQWNVEAITIYLGLEVYDRPPPRRRRPQPAAESD